MSYSFVGKQNFQIRPQVTHLENLVKSRQMSYDNKAERVGDLDEIALEHDDVIRAHDKALIAQANEVAKFKSDTNERLEALEKTMTTTLDDIRSSITKGLEDSKNDYMKHIIGLEHKISLLRREIAALASSIAQVSGTVTGLETQVANLSVATGDTPSQAAASAGVSTEQLETLQGELTKNSTTIQDIFETIKVIGTDMTSVRNMYQVLEFCTKTNSATINELKERTRVLEQSGQSTISSAE